MVATLTCCLPGKELQWDRAAHFVVPARCRMNVVAVEGGENEIASVRIHALTALRVRVLAWVQPELFSVGARLWRGMMVTP